MGKGSFQKLTLPVPAQIFSENTFNDTAIKPSGAVESLLQQNEDLMARLSVSLRRIAQLEEKLNISHQSNEKIKFQYDNLKDQTLILREKVSALSKRRSNETVNLQKVQQEMEALKEEAYLAEVRYADLYSLSKERQNLLIEKIDSHARRINRYMKYRKNIKAKVKELKDSVFSAETGYSELYTKSKRQIDGLNTNLDAITRKINRYRKYHLNIQLAYKALKTKFQAVTEEKGKLATQNSHITTKLNMTETRLKEVRERLSQTADYIQEQNKEAFKEQQQIKDTHKAETSSLNEKHKKEMAELKSNYSRKIEALDKELGSLQVKNQGLRDKCSGLEKVYEDNVQLQNKIIFTERKRDEVKSNLQQQLETLQKNLAHFRGQNKSLSNELEAHRIENSELAKNEKTLSSKQAGYEEQIETLQSLWKDTQHSLEKQVEKSQSLQNLNQQLSLKINAQKRDISQLKSQIDHGRMESTKQIQRLKNQSEMALSLKNKEIENQDLNPDLMNKIDSLIAEIQSGFSKK